MIIFKIVYKTIEGVGWRKCDKLQESPMVK
jgi:hypothetical protein